MYHLSNMHDDDSLPRLTLPDLVRKTRIWTPLQLVKTTRPLSQRPLLRLISGGK